MIRVTAWYEKLEESAVIIKEDVPLIWGDVTEERLKEIQDSLIMTSEKILKAYPKGLMNTLAENLNVNEDMQVKVVDRYMPEYGLPDEVLENTDVLIWWAHSTHEVIPDALVNKIKERVWKGMGLIMLHSAHPSKLTRSLLGTSGSLSCRDDDFCRVWTVNPSHPIAQGVPVYIDLDQEEMYGEPFDIPEPDELVFLSWFRGGEVFRSGCTWRRGYGKIFYFQPGHETYPTYQNPHICKIIENAIRWANPVCWREKMGCRGAVPTPEELWQKRQKYQEK